MRYSGLQPLAVYAPLQPRPPSTASSNPQIMVNRSFGHTPTSVSPPNYASRRAEPTTSPVRPHELTPGIPAEEYEWRRRQLMENLPNDSVVVSVAAPVKYMSGSA